MIPDISEFPYALSPPARGTAPLRPGPKAAIRFSHRLVCSGTIIRSGLFGHYPRPSASVADGWVAGPKASNGLSSRSRSDMRNAA